ncbi:hypothetical protein E2562_010324 [Oryza meyeriana var. granulata]|uniref:Uncharacterized protein n=1 Tax=Oryza meyeriana var. granulata TaxID=110450 RepID=A0A6G1F6E4_9ORYZ|nr:hypothetical protein E2562_010324 [Oryza meyeriana var. granulata]
MVACLELATSINSHGLELANGLRWYATVCILLRGDGLSFTVVTLVRSKRIVLPWGVWWEFIAKVSVLRAGAWDDDVRATVPVELRARCRGETSWNRSLMVQGKVYVLACNPTPFLCSTWHPWTPASSTSRTECVTSRTETMTYSNHMTRASTSSMSRGFKLVSAVVVVKTMATKMTMTA